MNKKVKYLILGGGVSGLSFALEKRKEDYLIIEKEKEIGGLCRTFYSPGYVWDVAGHFLHFHSAETKQYVTDLLKDIPLTKVDKCAKIYYDGKYMKAPFQYNIHELTQTEFLECLTDLYYAQENLKSVSFKEFVCNRFGKGISEKFLIPYNEKLYACDLDELDKDAMGQFLPKLTFDMLMSFYRGQKGTTYNDYFLYPTDGCVKLITKMAELLNTNNIRCGEEVIKVDVDKKKVITNNGDYYYQYLINTIPLNYFVKISGVGNHKKFRSNKILILNLGFDKQSIDKEVNWAYYPGNEVFYRVGWYNNIAKREKLSLYVEIGCKAEENINVQQLLEESLKDLKRVGVISDHKLISYNHIIVSPAYVHISQDSITETMRILKDMEEKNVYMIGRYARWEYSAIDDSIEQAQNLSLII